MNKHELVKFEEVKNETQNYFDTLGYHNPPKDIVEHIPFMQKKLKKGCYDIHYVINLLRIIEDKCEKLKMHPKDGIFTIKDSVGKLRAMLEVESNQ